MIHIFKWWMPWILTLSCQSIYGQSVRFNLTDIQIIQAAAVLQDFTGQAVLVDSDVVGMVTLFTTEAMKKQEAIVWFTTVLRARGFTIRSVAGELTISRSSSVPNARGHYPEDVFQTRIYTLKYLGVAEASPSVRTLMSRQGTISAKDNNTLIIYDRLSSLVKITQSLMVVDNTISSKNILQLQCVNASYVANLLQYASVQTDKRYDVDISKNTLTWQATDELWDEKFRDLVHALDKNIGCKKIVQLAAPVDSITPTVSAVNEFKRINQRADYEDSVKNSLAPASAQNIQQLDVPPAIIASSEDQTNQELMVALESWRSAWSRRDITAYFGLYGPAFLSSNQEDLRAWKKKRKVVMKRVGEVAIHIADIKIILTDDMHASTIFNQFYRSKKYKDIVNKNMQWTRTDGRWLITQENVEMRRILK